MLPNPLKYQDKVESAMARSYRTNIQPQSGSTYGLNDTITINIPTRNNLVLVPQESYLKFTHIFTNTSGANSTYRFDSCGAHGLIQSLKVFHGSNQLEFIDNYNVLAKMLYDLQMPSDAVYNKYNVLSGTRSDLSVSLSSFTTALPNDGNDAATTQALSNAIKSKIFHGQLSAFQRNTGEFIGTVANNASTTAKTYCLNLISILGTLCPQYIPLFACSSAPIRLEIQLVPSIISSCASTSNVGTMTLSNVEYVGNFIELSDPAIEIIRGSLGGKPLQFVVNSWRNAPGAISGVQNAAFTGNVPLPFKFSSLKAILIAQRHNATGAALRFPFSSVKNGLANYQFRIGSMVRPTKAPDTDGEIFAETLKAIGSIAELSSCPAIDFAAFTQNTNENFDNNDLAFTNQQSGSFYVGIDLENYPNAEKGRIYAGYNSNTDDIFWTPTYSALTVANLRIDAYAIFDQVVVFENGTAYVRF